MSFVRLKEIPPGSGNYYKYKVKNVREEGKTKQKVLDYLGPASSSEVREKTYEEKKKKCEEALED